MELNHELQKILDNNECFVHFLDFLDANRCSESVFFWRDCELYASLFQDLKREKENRNDDEIKRIERNIEAKASDIFEIYFSENSPYLINIEGKISKDITEKFQRGKKPSSDPDLFKKAQKAIFTLMKLDSYPRFLQSPYYDNMLRSIEQKDPSRFAALNFTPRSSSPASEVSNSPKKEKHEAFEMSTLGKANGLTNKIINKMKSTKIKVPKPHLSFSSNHSSAYSSEQALETTYNPREIVLSNKEIAEMKVFIDQSVTKLVVGAENDEKRVDLTLLLSDQDCDKLNHNFKTEAGRRYFADVLNRLRSSKSIPSAGFEILWRLIKVALINSDYYNDYCSAKMLMHMAATYFREVNGVRDYVYTRLKSIELWHKTRYWEFALYDAVANERDKVKISIKEWNKLSPEDRADRVASERGIFFGQLGSFAMHMLSVGLDVDSVRSFISKQCLVNALSEDQRDTLIGALPSMLHAVEESEKERSKIIDTSINSPMPNKKTSIEENPIQEKRDQLIKKKLAFEKQIHTLDTLISLCDELKDPSWEERNLQITEQMINQGFDEVRKMLDLKQKELIQNLREKSQEIIDGLNTNANEMRENKKKTLEAISGIEYMLDLKVPEAFAVAVQETEKKLDEHLLTSLKEKPNQLIVNDYSFYISFDKIKSEIQHLHTNDKLSIARWKVKNYSTSVSREVSSLFRLHGFNWRLVLHPHSSETEKISLYLEFMDSTTAVSWQLSVQFVLRIINQKNILNSKSSEVLTYAFGVDSKKCGCAEFLSNEELESNEGWISEDSVLFEVELLELDIIEENVTENV